MLKTGFIRVIDSRGRLTVPKRIRDIFKLDKVEILVENDLICIRKHNEVQKEQEKYPFGIRSENNRA